MTYTSYLTKEGFRYTISTSSTNQYGMPSGTGAHRHLTAEEAKAELAKHDWQKITIFGEVAYKRTWEE